MKVRGIRGATFIAFLYLADVLAIYIKTLYTLEPCSPIALSLFPYLWEQA